jgi:hypothetical protein
MKVIIAGTRHRIDPKEVAKAIKDSGFDISEVIEGAAKGVDLIARYWAHRNSIPVRRFPAKWDRYGKAAGVIRNQEMADWADALIALPCKHSKGTYDMIRRARDEGLQMSVYKVECFKK